MALVFKNKRLWSVWSVALMRHELHSFLYLSDQLIPIRSIALHFKDPGHYILWANTSKLKWPCAMNWFDMNCYCLFFYTCRYYQYLPRNPKKMFLWSLAKTFGSNKVIHCQASCIIDFRHSWIPGVFKLGHLFHLLSPALIYNQFINHNLLHNLWLIPCSIHFKCIRSTSTNFVSQYEEFRLRMLLVYMIWVFYNQVMMLIGKEMECVLRKYAIYKHITMITICADAENLCHTLLVLWTNNSCLGENMNPCDDLHDVTGV